MTWTVLPCGARAAMIEVADTPAAMHLAALLRAAALAGDVDFVDVVDVVAGARTVLVTADHDIDGSWLAPALDRLRGDQVEQVDRVLPAVDRQGSLVRVPVVYDGADLSDVADTIGSSVDDVIALHSDVIYDAAFCGFAPGFTYLIGLDPQLHLPRRGTPRTRVPAGSVGIGGEFTGVYPSASPGGWHLLGRTDVTLWDAERTMPALIPPGARVQFVRVEASARVGR